MPTLSELIAQRDALDREIELTKKRGRADAVAQVRALMAEHGLSAADIGISGRAAGKSAGRKAAIKYRDGATGDTWSGRGLQPKWLRGALASGRRIEEFAV